MGCDTKRLVGRDSTLEVAIQCSTENPATTTFEPLGAVTSKNFSIDGTTIEANDSLSDSGFTETQLSTSSISLSVSGNYVRDPTAYPNVTLIGELIKHRFDSVTVGLSEDPVILVKYARPDVTLTAYMIIVSISVEDPDAELSTYTMELTNASSKDYPPTMIVTV